ncbi:MAG: 50S ribosomal protein L11 methyltransferase [Bacteroidota bacterium]
MPASYVELAIRSDPFLFDEIIAILTMEGFEGFWEDGSLLKAYISIDRWDQRNEDAVAASLLNLTQGRSLAPPSLTYSVIEERNWNAEWEASVKPIRATERIVIAPTWSPYNGGAGDIVLTIDPKMSFGTGYHETTRLVLRLLERHLKPGSCVLDVGTGTGVLAIAALKLGAASAIGVDTDEWAYRNAIENAGLNDVGGRFIVQQGELTSVPERDFDLIMANIQRNVIVAMLEELGKRLAPDGILLISGLLSTERNTICHALLGAGMAIVEERAESEWIAFAAKFSEGRPAV